MKNQLIWVDYGDHPDFHDEAHFSIISALLRTRQRDYSLRVYTDAVEQFRSLPVETIAISKEDLRNWQGRDQYHYRIKPCVLKAALPLADKTVLVDTDTIFRKDPSRLFELVTDTTVLIDQCERSWGQFKAGRKYRAINSHLRSKYRIDDGMPVLNSGLIGLTRQGMGLIDSTLDAIDDLYVRSGRYYAMEQLALSVAIDVSEYRYVEHDQVIHHYWNKKAISRGMAKFWLEQRKHDYFSETAKSEMIKMGIDLPKLSPIPNYKARLKARKLNKGLRKFYRETQRAFYPYANPYWIAARPFIIENALKSLEKRRPEIFAQLPESLQEMLNKNLIDPTQLESIEVGYSRLTGEATQNAPEFPTGS
jgi:hypothetical protein